MGIFRMELGQAALTDRCLPEQFPGGAIQPQHALRLGRFVAGFQDDPIAGDAGTAMPSTRQRLAPDHLLGVAPLGH
jgi:hypothetical protein